MESLIKDAISDLKTFDITAADLQIAHLSVDAGEETAVEDPDPPGAVDVDHSGLGGITAADKVDTVNGKSLDIGCSDHIIKHILRTELDRSGL